MAQRRMRMTAEDRKEQLIELASQMIAKQGFTGFSISALAAAAGLTRAGVSHHVGSKEELLVEVIRLKERQSSQVTRDAVQRAGQMNPREILDILFRRNIERPEITHLFTTLAVESIRPDHPAHEYFADRITRGARQLRPLLESVSDHPERMAIEILSFMDGLQLNWLRDRSIDVWAHWSAFADRYVPKSGDGASTPAAEHNL
ncbi:TetR/AcrR family transcriptional regulator [Microbacterium gorillae]|uniref:TetR/AcrR family transcriptional regulator n=1 Tax=Microbacterium gorillae TaxID=1231063 RepID=UPI003D96D77B